MSATESDRTDSRIETTWVAHETAQNAIDIPALLANQIADLYAVAERERRVATTERAIARAKESV